MIIFFLKCCACILFSLFRCGTGRGRDSLGKIVEGGEGERRNDDS